MTNRFTELLRIRPWLLADGATGTSLFAAGLQSGDSPELWNVDHPERIEALHRSFIDAGADIVLTNSFGGTHHRLKLHGAQRRVAELNEASARIARQVADRADRPVVVAGSMGPTGELFEPLGALTPASGRAAFEEQAAALAGGGADVLWIETMSAREEVEAAVAGAAVTGLPIVVTVSFDTNGSTMMGVTPSEFAGFWNDIRPAPAAFGTNCGVGAAEVVACVLSMAGAAPQGVLVAKANCGVPAFVDGQIHYGGTPELMADYARLVRAAGARIIGGCCGTTPVHLSAMRAALEAAETCAPPSVDSVVERLGPVSRGALAWFDPRARARPETRGTGRRRRRSS